MPVLAILSPVHLVRPQEGHLSAAVSCQLPGPLGCLPQKVQPGALWEASDILHMIAAQVEPHTDSPGPAVSLGHPAAP